MSNPRYGIQATLAQARAAVRDAGTPQKPASLLEPSRPFTPAMPRQSTPYGMMSQDEIDSRIQVNWGEWRPETPVTRTDSRQQQRGVGSRPSSSRHNSRPSSTDNGNPFSRPTSGKSSKNTSSGSSSTTLSMRPPAVELPPPAPRSPKSGRKPKSRSPKLITGESVSPKDKKKKKELKAEKKQEVSSSSASLSGAPALVGSSGSRPPSASRGSHPDTKAHQTPRRIGSARSSKRSPFPNAENRSLADQIAALQAQWTAASAAVAAKPKSVFTNDAVDIDENTLTVLYENVTAAMTMVARPVECTMLCQLCLGFPFREQHKEVYFQCCEKIFALSQDKGHDQLVQSLLGTLVRCLRNPAPRGFKITSYLLGAVRNLSLEEQNQSILVQEGAVSCLGALLKPECHLQQLKLDPATSVKLLAETCGVLRNLVNDASHADFLPDDVLLSICSLLQKHPTQHPLLLNVHRVLSKLSLYPACRAVIETKENIQSMVHTLEKHNNKLSMCVRICFTLGNFTVDSDEQRRFIAEDCDGVRVLLFALTKNCDRDKRIANLKQRKMSADATAITGDRQRKDSAKAEAMDREINEMLVKLVRLIANLAINRAVGPGLAQQAEVGLLLQLLQTKDVEKHEELVLNVISAITNLSFYYDKDPVTVSSSSSSGGGSYVLIQMSSDILACLIPHLFSSNVEVVVESVRALGNFSRDVQFRADMRACRVDETLVLLLDHSDNKVVFGVCGVLLNVAADPAVHSILFDSDYSGLDKLLSCLARFGLDDFALTDVVLKLFLNLKASIGDTFPSEIRKRLLHLVEQLVAHCEKEEGELQEEKKSAVSASELAHLSRREDDLPTLEDVEVALQETWSLLSVCKKVLVVFTSVAVSG
mmetsp:Transcript_20615/g.40822  ORF Transcript_20615/g.40822 Transcript_20615/m.40822 type:complete len:876 (+) Transcript_20615:32-2659(+)